MKKSIRKKFSLPKNPIDFDALSSKHSKLSQRAFKKFGLTKEIETVALETKKDLRTKPRREVLAVASITLGNEILKRLCGTKNLQQYNTVRELNAKLIRTRWALSDLKTDHIRKQFLIDVLDQGAVICKEFSETKRSKKLKDLALSLRKLQGDWLGIDEEFRKVFRPIITGIDDLYYLAMINILGEKKVAVFDALDSICADKLIEQIHPNQ